MVGSIAFGLPRRMPSTDSEADLIASLGDFVVFGRYTILVFLVHLFDVTQMGLSYTYSTYAVNFPKIHACGNLTFDEHSKVPQTCALIELEHRGIDPCEPVFETGFTSMPAEFDYYCDGIATVKSALSIQMTAMILGSVIMGQLSDIFGRKPMLLLGSAATALFHLAASFTYTLTWYTVMEFGALFATSGVVTVVYVYFVEMTPKNHRLWASMVFSESPAMMASAAIAYYAGDWRTMARVMAAISIPHLILQAYAFESPRWLITRGRFDEAEVIYRKMDEFNGTSNPDRVEALKGLMDAERERALLHTKKAAKNYYVWHAFGTKEMAVSNLVMGFNFFVMSLSYYGLMLNMETLSGSVFMNVFTMATMCYIFNVTYAILDVTIPKLGRKPAYIFPLLVVLICLGTVVTLKTLDIFMPWLETGALLVSMAIVAQQLSVAPIIGGELFPTPVRNAAQSFQQLCMRSGVIVSPQLFVGLKAWPIAPYLTLAVLNLGVVVTFGWFIRETKGVELVEHMPPKKSKIIPV